MKKKNTEQEKSISHGEIQEKIDELKSQRGKIETHLDMLRQEATRLQTTADKFIQAQDAIDAQILILQSLLY